MAAAACCRHLDIRVCIPGAHIPLLLGPVRPGPHRGVLHHHPGPTRPLCQGIPLRVCISVSVSRYHRLLRQVSNNNQPLIDAARTASIISLSLSLHFRIFFIAHQAAQKSSEKKEVKISVEEGKLLEVISLKCRTGWTANTCIQTNEINSWILPNFSLGIMAVWQKKLTQ